MTYFRGSVDRCSLENGYRKVEKRHSIEVLMLRHTRVGIGRHEDFKT